MTTGDFRGAKLAILVGDRIVVILRDDITSIPWPGDWDLPGGAREPGESPADCVIRETQEELGLDYSEADFCWSRDYVIPSGARDWFFVTEQPDFDPAQVHFGCEGQEWRISGLDWYLGDPRVIPHQRDHVKDYLEVRNR
jgi:8-oxo-dGTP diphosphatase